MVSIRRWQDALLGVGAAAFLVVRGSPIIAILASALLGFLLYKNSGFRPRENSGHEHGAPWQSLGAPLLMISARAAGLFLLFCLDRKLFDLSVLMLKVDLFAFGGGYASVPLMLHEVVGARHWIDSKTFMDGIALGQVTPGPIVITATFVGYLVAGLPGALVGSASIFTPSLVLLTAAVPYSDRLQGNALCRRGLRGALASFVGLLLAVTIQFTRAIHWGIYQVLIAIVAFLALRLEVHILWVVLVGAVDSPLIL